MKAYGIKINSRRWLAVNTRPGATKNGARPYVWTTDISAAEKFSGVAEADEFARQVILDSDAWRIVPIPPVHRGNPDGGSAISMQTAA